MTPTELYAYHRWANRRLFDVASALGEETCAREIGKQFSLPSLRPRLRRRCPLALTVEGTANRRHSG
jgi:hypothetical protein